MPKVHPPGHPAYTEAIEAMRRYHEAQRDGACAKVVERLRLLAETVLRAFTDYQLRAWGGPGGSVH